MSKTNNERSSYSSLFVTTAAFLCLIPCCTNAFLLGKPRNTKTLVVSSTTPDIFFATTVESSTSTADATDDSITTIEQRRILGSQELLMLPRQYGPNYPKVTFPQLNHVSATILSSTPSEDCLRTAIDRVMLAHPLLQCHVEGDGEPDKRIDLFQMVREGEPNPCTFVSGKEKNINYNSNDVLKVVDLSKGGSNDNKEQEDDARKILDESWQKTFEHDLDNGDWCDVNTGPLWKVEWHHFSTDGKDKPCALIFSFNHAISDQSSANKLTDQIVYQLALAEEEENDTLSSVIPKAQPMPMSVEDSVMGQEQRWNDVQVDGMSLNTALYVAGKAAEGFRSPVILPDASASEQEEEEEEANSFLGALTIISGKAAGGEDESSSDRKSTVQYRTLSADLTSALLAKCRQNSVAVTNALTAAITLTSSDFIDGGVPKGSEMERNYKVLQSLDMRRFGQSLDKGETVACMAGSMDLMHGPIPDRTGEQLRSTTTAGGAKRELLTLFWDLARDGKQQTEKFVNGGGPYQAVRVFDFAMSIGDMNNLVHLTAQSKDTKGRAYSAGIANAGVYERQTAYANNDDEGGSSSSLLLQTQHGRFCVEDVHFATSHARSGCLYQLSCLTVGGELKLTFHPASPIVTETVNADFANAYVELLQTIASS